MVEKLPFQKLDHVGIIVRDLDQAVKYYESLGIGPFEPSKGIVYKERRVMGKPVPLDSIKIVTKIGYIGPIYLQVTQPVSGESIWKEFLEKKGEGVQHLGFLTDDIEREETRLAQKGIKAVYSSRFQNGGGAAYFDTGKVGGVLFELVQWPK